MQHHGPAKRDIVEMCEECFDDVIGVTRPEKAVIETLVFALLIKFNFICAFLFHYFYYALQNQEIF